MEEIVFDNFELDFGDDVIFCSMCDCFSNVVNFCYDLVDGVCWIWVVWISFGDFDCNVVVVLV